MGLPGLYKYRQIKLFDNDNNTFLMTVNFIISCIFKQLHSIYDRLLGYEK
jgi:hypothetical protein